MDTFHIAFQRTSDIAQCLEAAAKKSGTCDKLKSFFSKVILAEVENINKLERASPGDWIQQLKRQNNRFAEQGLLAEDQKKDSRFIFQLAAANIDMNDPELLRRKFRLQDSLFESLRDKVRLR